MMRILRRLNQRITYRILGGGIVATTLFLLHSDWRVRKNAQNKTFDTVESTPNFRTGLVLGTSKYVRSGRINLYYKNRIEATFQLWKAGKIKNLIISGDNGTVEYNEPETFKADLVKLGMDSNRIFLDYAGFRTFDSVVRAKEVFGQDSICFISQKFHNERALYIASQKGIVSIGFNAKDVNLKYGIRVRIRETFARAKVMLDTWFGKSPKFLGDPVRIPAG
jgi:SanA protein